MRHRCAYRVAENGEIIFSYYNDETFTIEGVPESLFKHQFSHHQMYLYNRNYEKYYSPVPDLEMEYSLMYSKYNCIGIEVGCDFILEMDFGGAVAFRGSIADSETSIRYGTNARPFHTDLKYCGLVATEVRQLYFNPPIQRMYYDSTRGLLVTCKGIIKPEFDCSNICQKFSGTLDDYKHMVDIGGKYIFTEDDGFKILDSDLNILEVKKY